MAALLLWESRAGGALLAQYPSPNNPIHLQTPHAAAPREALSRPDRIGENIEMEVAEQRHLEKLVLPLRA